MTGMLGSIKNALKKRKFERRVNKLFDGQAADNRRKKARRHADMPTFKP